MSLDAANAKAVAMHQHPQENAWDPAEISPVPDLTRCCFVCLRNLDVGSRKRRMVWLCSRHTNQDLGLFYMQLSDTGRYQTFPEED